VCPARSTFRTALSANGLSIEYNPIPAIRNRNHWDCNLKANIAVNIKIRQPRYGRVCLCSKSGADVRLRWNWSKTDRGRDDNLESFGSSPFGSPNVTKTTCSSMSCATVDSRSDSTSYWVSFCETRNRNHWGDRLNCNQYQL